MSLYLDASVVIPTLVGEAGIQAAERIMVRYAGALLLSDFTVAEVASAFSKLVRMKHISQAEAQSRLIDFDEWREAATAPAEIVANDMKMAAVFVRHFQLKLRAPDALHLAVCRRRG